MSEHSDIVKIALAITCVGGLLVVRKRGTVNYILPGGKPESDESDSRALRREIDEELGCELDERSLVFLGSFSDRAADEPDKRVIVRLYSGNLKGTPKPRTEIEEVKWFFPERESAGLLAPSIKNHIIPFLSENRLI